MKVAFTVAYLVNSVSWHTRGDQGVLVIGDKGNFLLVKWWNGCKFCGDLVIQRSCGDGDLAKKNLVILALKSWWFGEFVKGWWWWFEGLMTLFEEYFLDYYWYTSPVNGVTARNFARHDIRLHDCRLVKPVVFAFRAVFFDENNKLVFDTKKLPGKNCHIFRIFCKIVVVG